MTNVSTSPVIARNQAYNLMFGNTPDTLTFSDESLLTLSGLCRATRRSGGRSAELVTQLELVNSTIDSALNLGGLSDQADVQESIKRENIATVVKGIFQQWEIARSRAGQEPLLGLDEDKDKALIELSYQLTEDAVNEIGIFDISRKNDRNGFSNLLACWGPEYMKRWFDGTIFRKWAAGLNMDQHAIAELESTMSPHILKNIATKRPTNPIATLEKIRQNIDSALGDEAIAKEFGIEVDEASSVVARNIRIHIAVHNINDPLGALKRFRENEDPAFFYPNLAEALGTTERVVKYLLPTNIRQYFALHYPTDPIKAAEKWATERLDSGIKRDNERTRKLGTLGLAGIEIGQNS